ncbi:hypothetical protein, partial [Streptococcus suis]|uniref:hypothetical protein n=1 Tax=Streptococcus suis TaxID=1307 RepID=UPI001EDD5A18
TSQKRCPNNTITNRANLVKKKSDRRKVKQVFKKYLIFIKLNIDFIKIKCKIILNKYLIDV